MANIFVDFYLQLKWVSVSSWRIATFEEKSRTSDVKGERNNSCMCMPFCKLTCFWRTAKNKSSFCAAFFHSLSTFFSEFAFFSEHTRFALKRSQRPQTQNNKRADRFFAAQIGRCLRAIYQTKCVHSPLWHRFDPYLFVDTLLLIRVDW